MGSTTGAKEISDVAIVTAWYPPEAAPFGHMMLELANELVDAGMRVDVITSVPNHPEGVLFPGWKNRLIQIERPREGMRVLRVGAWLRPSAGRNNARAKLHRVVGYLAFTLMASMAVLLRVRTRVLFAVLQPLSVGPVMEFLARLKRAKLVFNIQDLHPDAAVSLGLIKNGMVIRLLKYVERRAYAKADTLSVISEGFRQHCIALGAKAEKVEVISNWIDLEEVRPLTRPSELRHTLGIGPDAFVVLYAGTIGYVSGAEIMLEVADQLRDIGDVHIVFIGEGQLVPRLKEESTSRSLANLHFLPFQPREKLNEVQGIGDVSVVTLLRGHGRTSVPSKVLGYMASGRAVIAAVDIDSETARMVRTAGAGMVTASQDATDLVAGIQKLYGDRKLARELGAAGRRYLESFQSKPSVLARYRNLFSRLMD